VRFKVRTITFTSLTNSAKGILAIMTSESQDNSGTSGATTSGGGSGAAAANVSGGAGAVGPPLVRRRSSSIGLAPDEEVPAVMQIIGAANDFGLGLTSWW
jgi:hypothetical protein